MKKILVFVAFIGLAGDAFAHEQVVRLKRGATVSGILEQQGCSRRQVAQIWRLVMADSGLNPAEHRRLSVGKPISVERDCNGNPMKSTAVETLLVEKKGLEKRVSGLNKDLVEMTSERDSLRSKLTQLAQLPQVENKVASQNSYRPRSLWFLLSLLLVGAGGFAIWLFYKPEPVKQAPLPIDTRELRLPSEVVIQHWGSEHIFYRKEDPEHCKVGYECPHCRVWLSAPRTCEQHMRSKHADTGRLALEMSEGKTA